MIVERKGTLGRNGIQTEKGSQGRTLRTRTHTEMNNNSVVDIGPENYHEVVGDNGWDRALHNGLEGRKKLSYILDSFAFVGLGAYENDGGERGQIHQSEDNDFLLQAIEDVLATYRSPVAIPQEIASF